MKLLNSLISQITRIGATPDDSDDIRLQKSLLVFSSLMMSISGFLWGVIYLIFGEALAASIPSSYGVLSFLSIAYFIKTRRYGFFRFTQLLFSLLLPFFLMLSLGGFVYSSAVVLWSFTCPLGALLFAGRRQAMRWFLAYVAVIFTGAFLEPFGHTASNLPQVVQTGFFALNITGTSTVAFVLLQYFVHQKDTALELLHLEQNKSESLLLNILPKDIAQQLKEGKRTIADHYDEVSVLFADIVNFTPLSARMDPAELVDLLNEVFSYFDELVLKYDLEKIKTIGDCYMVAAGVPHPRSDHAQVLASMALEVQEHFKQHRFNGRQLSFRVGINSGPVVAGVIGRMKFIYDLWGDAVNTASRMESHGVGGHIQITESTYELIKEDFICEPGGKIDVKGKGEMPVWYVVAPN